MGSEYREVKANKINLNQLEEEKDFSDVCKYLLEIRKQQIESKFYDYVEKLKTQRRLVLKQIAECFKKLNHMYIDYGKNRFVIVSEIYKDFYKPDVDIKYKSLLNFDIPTIKLEMNKQGRFIPGAFQGTPLDFQDNWDLFHDTLKSLLKLIEIDYVTFQYLENSSQISRRIQALNEIVIPGLKEQISYIQEQLEDEEQEELVNLHQIKKMYYSDK